MLLPVPFSSRAFALPVLFRLYRTVKSCERSGQPHRKKTELARELLDVPGTWVSARRVEIAADSAYCNDTVTRGLPDNFVLFGAMRRSSGSPRASTARPHRNPAAAPLVPAQEGPLCFADVLRAAQRALTPLDVLDPRRSLANLRRRQQPARRTGESRLRRAA